MPTSVESMELNSRVETVQPSATLAMKARAAKLQRAGRPIVSLSAGEPDFDTPAPIAEAGRRAIDEGFTHYTENAGTPALREAISAKFERDNDLAYAPDQILCSNGAKQSLALAVHVLCRRDDEVLIPAPYWVSYPEMVRFAGGEPVVIPTPVKNGYRLTPEALEAAITPRTRLLMLCSPSNPTGTVYTPEELQALADVLRDHPEVWILSDEIYEHVRYDAEHVSFAALPGMKARTLTVNGFSKAFAMTGWRLGYLAGPEAVVQAAAKVQGNLTSAPSSISQKAGVAALEMEAGPVQEMVRAFRERRDFLLGRLQALDGVRCPEPQGAFYLFPDVSAFFGSETPAGAPVETSEELCFYLLDACNVALVPGSAFGAPAGLRFSYAAAMEDLRIAADRIEKGLAALR